jgi:hypothetical protein
VDSGTDIVSECTIASAPVVVHQGFKAAFSGFLSEKGRDYAAGLLETTLRTHKRIIEQLTHSASTMQGHFILPEVKLKEWHDTLAVWCPGDGNVIVLTCCARRNASRPSIDAAPRVVREWV